MFRLHHKSRSVGFGYTELVRLPLVRKRYTRTICFGKYLGALPTGLEIQFLFYELMY